MTIALLVTAILIFWRLGYPIFEAVIGLILITPIAAYGLSPWFGMDRFMYLSVFGMLLVFFAALKIGKKHFDRADIGEFIDLLVLFCAFRIFRSYALSWPDFIQIGERLRDYALLSSVIHSPINLNEPWAVGFTLNYYAYWYRFGHFISSIFELPTWEVYHSLQSFTYALFLACAFRIFRKYLNFTPIFAAVSSIGIAIGSNLSGVTYYLKGDDNWWGPSRVIKGAIDEFPAWSFLLGDLHPHYLNLPLLPFFALVLLAIRPSLLKASQVLIAILTGYVTCTLWVYNANAWEMPVWFALLTGVLLVLAVKTWLDLRSKTRTTFFSETESFDWRTSAVFLLLLFITNSLYLSQKNINPAKYPIDWVTSEIGRTSVHEMALHFGIPLAIICVTFSLSFQGSILRIFSALSIVTLLIFNDALPFLICIGIAGAYRLWLEIRKSECSIARLIIEAMGVGSIALVIVPEVVFFNDPYGSDIERMNTIFKIYSAAWFWIHLYAFYLLGTLYPAIKLNREYVFSLNSPKKIARFVGLYAAPCFLSIMLISGFFRSTASRLRPLRNEKVEPISRGLSEINTLFPGSADTIKAVSKFPRGVILEAQGKPYDYTTHVATLSEQPAYLGWANHVNLLSNNDERVGKRERISDQIYNEQDCSAKKVLLKSEGISYVVFGPLEKMRHTQASAAQFACLRSMIKFGEYEVFAVN